MIARQPAVDRLCLTCFRPFRTPACEARRRPVLFCSAMCRTDRRPFTALERLRAEALYRAGDEYAAIAADLGRTVGGIAGAISEAIGAGRLMPRHEFCNRRQFARAA